MTQNGWAKAPGYLNICRTSLQAMAASDGGENLYKNLESLRGALHTFASETKQWHAAPLTRLASALEALLEDVADHPGMINRSLLRTLAQTLDLLTELTRLSPGALEEPVTGLALAVDDEPLSRRAVRRALPLVSIPVITTGDPMEALSLLQENSFELICLDIEMPEMDGFQLCSTLRELPAHRHVPVIFLTGLTDIESRSKSILSGGNDFISKPVLPIELSVKALSYIIKSKLSAVYKKKTS